AALPTRWTAVEKNAFCARASVILIPPIATSNFCAARSVVRFAQMVGTNSTAPARPSELDRDCATSMSAPM
nr:hypothetical protein [Tanacetum cinerariifolium]